MECRHSRTTNVSLKQRTLWHLQMTEVSRIQRETLAMVMPGMLLWLVELVGWVTGWLSSWLVACLVWFDLIDRMDGWTDGWMDGWLDGRMDGWTARTSNPPIHQLCIQSCTVCRTENVDAKVSNELWRPSLLKTNMPPKKWWLENEFSF